MHANDSRVQVSSAILEADFQSKWASEPVAPVLQGANVPSVKTPGWQEWNKH